MTKKLVTLRPEMDVMEAVALLLRHRISGAPVVDAAGQEPERLQGEVRSIGHECLPRVASLGERPARQIVMEHAVHRHLESRDSAAGWSMHQPSQLEIFGA